MAHGVRQSIGVAKRNYSIYQLKHNFGQAFGVPCQECLTSIRMIQAIT